MDKRNSIRQKIFLAALLHDIGKFYQRADKRYADKESELSEYSKNIAEDICPVNSQGRFGYQHVIWTNEFFEKFNKKFEELPGVKENRYQESSIDNIVTYACNHHKPQSLLQSFITLGDWWSAGIDRTQADTFEKEEKNDEKKINWGRERYKTIPLFSIFDSISINNENAPIAKNGFNLSSLNLDKEDIFSKPIHDKEDGVSETKYYTLWKQFESEFEEIPTDNIESFTECLIFLLKKFTWCIPSNTMDMANVSLFDHLKTTAAFADCIYTFYSEGNENKFTFNQQNNRISLEKNMYPVMLLGGDVSGIQKFIYNIASKKAAISLKGRSFYVQLLIDSLIQKIITHPDIRATFGHVVYSSGGKFYMILPNTAKVKSAIEDIKIEVEEELWSDHKGNLSVHLATVGFAMTFDKERKISIEGVKEKSNLGDLWRMLAEKLHVLKNRKFESIIKSFSSFEVNRVGGDIKTCAVTGEELDDNNCVKLEDTDKYISKAVEKHIKLGTTLKDVDYLITYREPKDNSNYLSNRSKAHIKVVGIDHYLFDQVELTLDNADFRKITSADVSRITLFNDTNALAAKLKGNAVSYGFQFYGGNKQAIVDKGNKTFEQLTEVCADDKKHETYLGVLRMDVDGLGNIFIKGLKEKDKSFSAYATMSFQLDLFFSGYLNTIRNSDKYKNAVNILYSGGDDVFAIGRWDLLIDFAEEIRTEFASFIGREDISISAGLTIVRNKYPIAKAAEMAEEAEAASKKHDGGKKNAITFLGETISWKEEFPEVKKTKETFVKLYNGGKGMPTSLLHKIMEFYEIKKAGKDLSYVWNTAYYMKRLAERNKNKPDVEQFAKELPKKLLESNAFKIYALAARWAELQIREIENQKQNEQTR